MADGYIPQVLTEVASEMGYRATLKPFAEKALTAVLPSSQQYPTPMLKLYREGVEFFAGRVLEPVLDSFIPPAVPAKWLVCRAASEVLSHVVGHVAEFGAAQLKK